MYVSKEDTKLQTGWGVEDVDRFCRRQEMWGGVPGDRWGLDLESIVTRAPPCDGPEPHTSLDLTYV